MASRLREFAQIVSKHFRFYFNLLKGVAFVHSNFSSYELGYYNHVTTVGSEYFVLALAGADILQ